MRIENGKIIISKSQWTEIGKKQGWIFAENQYDNRDEFSDKYNDIDTNDGLFKTFLFRIKNKEAQDEQDKDLYYDKEDALDEVDSFIELNENEEYDDYVEIGEAEIFYTYSNRSTIDGIDTPPSINLTSVECAFESNTGYVKINPDNIIGIEELKKDILSSIGVE